MTRAIIATVCVAACLLLTALLARRHPPARGGGHVRETKFTLQQDEEMFAHMRAQTLGNEGRERRIDPSATAGDLRRLVQEATP